MMSPQTNSDNKLSEVAGRIREMREISDFSIEEMAEKIQRTLEYCRKVVEARTPFRISQKQVELNRL